MFKLDVPLGSRSAAAWMPWKARARLPSLLFMALAYMFTTTSAAVAAKPAHLYAKVGANNKDVTEALINCEAGAKPAQGPRVNSGAVSSMAPNSAYGPTAPNVVAGAVVGGVAQAIFDARARRSALRACMRESGFALLELTDAEDTEYNNLRDDDARATWQANFLRTVAPERINSGLRPKATPLPPARDEPFVIGGVRLDVPSLVLATEPVRRGALVQGDGIYRRLAHAKVRAQIGETKSLSSSGEIIVPETSVFYQLYNRSSNPSDAYSDRTLWCGDAEVNGKPWFSCIQSTFDGYLVLPLLHGSHWLIGKPAYDVIALLKPREAALDMEELPLESTPAFRVALNVQRLTKKGVWLSAVATKQGEDVEFWSGFVPFDASGHGNLPFWDRTLAMTYGSAGLTASFEPSRDGRGWDDLPASP